MILAYMQILVQFAYMPQTYRLCLIQRMAPKGAE